MFYIVRENDLTIARPVTRHLPTRAHSRDIGVFSKSMTCFSDIIALTMVSTGKRPYTCHAAGCGKPFARRNTLLKHFKRQHPGLPPPSTAAQRTSIPAPVQSLGPRSSTASMLSQQSLNSNAERYTASPSDAGAPTASPLPTRRRERRTPSMAGSPNGYSEDIQVPNSPSSFKDLEVSDLISSNPRSLPDPSVSPQSLLLDPILQVGMVPRRQQAQRTMTETSTVFPQCLQSQRIPLVPDSTPARSLPTRMRAAIRSRASQAIQE